LQKIDDIVLQTRGGLAPQILVGFFFKGPPKKNCCKNEIAELKKKYFHKSKKKKGHDAEGPPIA
jgi:hypothetical protein